MPKTVSPATASAGKKTLAKLSLLSDTSVVDPKVASLFSASPKKKIQEPATVRKAAKQPSVSSSSSSSGASEESSELSSSDSSNDDSEESSSESVEELLPRVNVNPNESLREQDEDEEDEGKVEESSEELPKRSRKRQRDDAIDTAEAKYFARLAKEDIDDDDDVDIQNKPKRQKQSGDTKGSTENLETTRTRQNGTSSRINNAEDDYVDNENDDDDEDNDEDEFVPPQHETVTNSTEHKLGADFDKAARTIFLANVSNEAMTSKSARKTLMAYLKSILPLLPESSLAHDLESLRFRSTAYSTPLPKRAAFARKDLMDATTKSTNAYAVYTTKLAAKEAAQRLNGTVVLGRHIRVDLVEHPAKIEHHRCIFVGNLGYVDDDSQVREEEADRTGRKQQKKKHPPGDVEEGLWRTFSAVGKVENVRVVRDPKTRVGKGFGYVQFADDVAVEEALQLDSKRFPPLLPRKLRISRAKKPVKKRPDAANARPAGRPGVSRFAHSKGDAPNESQARKPADNTLKGRVGKLLGRAGAANMAGLSKTLKKPEEFIFEGYRASRKQGVNGLVGNAGSSARKKGGKPRTRSAKRGAEFKAKGGKPKK